MNEAPPSENSEQVDQRLLIALFARGAIGEHLQSAVLPWMDAYEETGREGILARHVEEVWTNMDREWRFFGAIDGCTSNLVMTVPTLGWIGLQRGGEEPLEDTVAAEPRQHDAQPDYRRRLIVLFTAGAVGELLQTGVLPWHKEYAEAGREVEIAAEIEAIAGAMPETWRFFGALDNATGDIVTNVPALGWLALQRMRAHDTLTLEDDAPPLGEWGTDTDGPREHSG